MIIMLIIGLMAPVFFHRIENEKRNFCGKYSANFSQVLFHILFSRRDSNEEFYNV